jgi:hypothetical protein
MRSDIVGLAVTPCQGCPHTMKPRAPRWAGMLDPFKVDSVRNRRTRLHDFSEGIIEQDGSGNKRTGIDKYERGKSGPDRGVESATTPADS